jgi:nicotinate-nucleotide--dimethylbenzimidazole phosphoribosyltransferase
MAREKQSDEKQVYTRTMIPPFEILPVGRENSSRLQARIDAKTKPMGSLGLLEPLALNLGLILRTDSPSLRLPHIVVFAGDHGIAAEGVSAYPQEVTRQMVLNFLQGGAAINVFARQHGIGLTIVDAGVKGVLPPVPGLRNDKIANGTRSFLHGPAMTSGQCSDAITRGSAVVGDLQDRGCNVVGFGEMGIGNTSAAAVIMHRICRVPLEACVGRGAGLDEEGLDRKRALLEEASGRAPPDLPPLSVLERFGGFEIAMMCGAMLKAAECGMVVLVDGFVATAAVLVAHALYPDFLGYCVFTHLSAEPGHGRMLEPLGARPLLRLDMRLGEGTGCALAYPLLQSALRFLEEMATFDSAHVHERKP